MARLTSSEQFKLYWIAYALNILILCIVFPIGMEVFTNWKFYAVLMLQGGVITAASFAGAKDKTLG